MHERLMAYGCILVWIIAGLDDKLRTAAWKGDAAGVREWLEAGADPNAPNPESGWTAMHSAAIEGKSVEVLEVLRGAGAEVDKAAEGGWTPLMLAAGGATGAVLRWLLEHGADWRLQGTSGDYAGKNALGFAKQYNKAEAASVLAAWVSEHGSAEEAAAAAAE
jgi:ankyrin repeat protein